MLPRWNSRRRSRTVLPRIEGVLAPLKVVSLLSEAKESIKEESIPFLREARTVLFLGPKGTRFHRFHGSPIVALRVYASLVI